VQFERARQALHAARGRFAAHAGIHDAVSVPFGLQPLFEQGDPALFRPDTVGRAQAVAQHQDDPFRRGRSDRASNE